MDNNPALNTAKFCILAMVTPTGNFANGFVPVGPFDTEAQAVGWACTNITNTKFDNPHWVVAPMVGV